MNIKYQLIILGAENPLIKMILASFNHHIGELGLKKESVIVITEINFKKMFKANAPAFCIYFGEDTIDFRNIDILNIILKEAVLILPVVNNIKLFNKHVPPEIRNINGFELSSKDEIEKLVSCVLEGLSLLRLSRRLFISYKRDESTAVAIQLFEKLEKNGFDVFLDTHSIRPGESFQEELWHRMADTDVVVLLNTPGFLKSNWTAQELAKANSMSIGILQLIWPTHVLERHAEISIPFQLTQKDFQDKIFNKSKSILTPKIVSKIVGQIESLRARTLASRQDNIITEFISSAKRMGKLVDLQPDKFITVKKENRKEIIVIPTVGVPQAFTYNQSEELVFRIKSKKVSDIFLLYDHRNIREKWLKHLMWLDNYLPVKTIKIVEAEEWFKTI